MERKREMKQDIEDQKAYQEAALNDLPEHILEPHSLSRAPVPSLSHPPRFSIEDRKEINEAEHKGYTRGDTRESRTGRQVWIGPSGGEWAWNPRTSTWYNVRNASQMPLTAPPEEKEELDQKELPSLDQISSNIDHFITRIAAPSRSSPTSATSARRGVHSCFSVIAWEDR